MFKSQYLFIKALWKPIFIFCKLDTIRLLQHHFLHVNRPRPCQTWLFQRPPRSWLSRLTWAAQEKRTGSESVWSGPKRAKDCYSQHNRLWQTVTAPNPGAFKKHIIVVCSFVWYRNVSCKVWLAAGHKDSATHRLSLKAGVNQNETMYW